MADFKITLLSTISGDSDMLFMQYLLFSLVHDHPDVHVLSPDMHNELHGNSISRTRQVADADCYEVRVAPHWILCLEHGRYR